MSTLSTPKTIKWNPNKKGKIIERRIANLIKRFKAFYLECGDEVFFIDSGNWVHAQNENGKYNTTIAHAKNFFPFMNGKRPIKWNSWKDD